LLITDLHPVLCNLLVISFSSPLDNTSPRLQLSFLGSWVAVDRFWACRSCSTSLPHLSTSTNRAHQVKFSPASAGRANLPNLRIAPYKTFSRSRSPHETSLRKLRVVHDRFPRPTCLSLSLRVLMQPCGLRGRVNCQPSRCQFASSRAR